MKFFKIRISYLKTASKYFFKKEIIKKPRKIVFFGIKRAEKLRKNFGF